MKRSHPASPADLPGTPPGKRSGQVQGESQVGAAAEAHFQLPIPAPARIRDLLLEALPRRFPGRTFRKVDGEYPEIHVQAQFAEFGEFLIGDDDDEAIVQASRFSHAHFGCYDEQLTPARRQEVVVEDVLNFLERVFADQVVFWGTQSRGGWYQRDYKPSTPISAGDRGPEYVWSGPLKSA